ncbi:MAG: sulfotransferase [candidate division KSB1 bacterium]|nr:sulfotransferase [candidate division KSB1 bacterium]MDZ7367394.1 sulfotransferase [candidate division KSB1 bacterium]MDZ7405275.1 sulfotransferase [candidate division KSB1 bacterium]
MRSEKRLILVTGVPRSGTTAVGQMLALAPDAGALHEPFNYHSGLKNIEHYFEIPGSHSFSLARLDETIVQIKNLELAFKPGIFPSDKGLRRAVKYVIGARPLNSYRRLRLQPNLRTIIWKDPLACFTADHAAKQHEVKVLVTLRNPWAVAGSFKRMEWAFDLSDLAARLQQIGVDFCRELAGVDETIHASVANAALLWRMIYSTLACWAQVNTRIRFLNLDDVVGDPVATYKKLYQLLALDWNGRIAAKIATYYRSESERSVPKEKKAHDSGRNLAEVNTYWRGYLTEAEKDFVGKLTKEPWSEFQKICV